MKKLLMMILAAVILSACTSLKTPEINGVVVDAETGKPIEGARIYVKWQKTISGPGGRTDGAIEKEVRLQAKEDGKFIIPAHRLTNFIPYPLGQGGSFYMIVYAHGYMYKRYVIYTSDAITSQADLRDYSMPAGIILKLAVINHPRDWRENLGAIPEIETTGINDYIHKEYRLFIDKFGKRRWDRVSQDHLAMAYERFGDYKAASKKIEEIIEDYPEEGKHYSKALDGYKAKIKRND